MSPFRRRRRRRRRASPDLSGIVADPELSVADNILINQPPKRFGLIDRRRQSEMAEAALARAGATDIHPRTPVKDLPLSRRQMVEIAKALARNPRLFILDEATSALTAADVERVLALLRRLRDEGLALAYISHRMHEIAEIADDCTIFRNGRNVATYLAGTKTHDEVVELMIGREYRHVFPAKPRAAHDNAPPRLELRGLSWTNRLKDISLNASAGEIVGLGGLDGQGQRELLLALFGALSGLTGEIRVEGEQVRIGSPKQAKTSARDGADPRGPQDRRAYAADERRRQSLLRGARRLFVPWLHRSIGEARAIDGTISALSIKVAKVGLPVASLSGGNQQKVVIGKWLMTGPRIILLNDPTRGIDVGTKQEIYALLRRLADAGAAIVFYSTDYAELIGCCDRVLVLYDGQVKRTLVGEEITEKALIASALNLDVGAATERAS